MGAAQLRNRLENRPVPPVAVEPDRRLAGALRRTADNDDLTRAPARRLREFVADVDGHWARRDAHITR